MFENHILEEYPEGTLITIDEASLQNLGYVPQFHGNSYPVKARASSGMAEDLDSFEYYVVDSSAANELWDWAKQFADNAFDPLTGKTGDSQPPTAIFFPVTQCTLNQQKATQT